MADPATTIGMRDFVTGHRVFRLAASEFDSFDDLVQRTYAKFRRQPREFTLHIHFQPETPCTLTELLNAEEWDAGEYFIGSGIEFFAHFVERGDAQNARVPTTNRTARVEGMERRHAIVGTMPASAAGRRSRDPTAGSRLSLPPIGAQRGTAFASASY